MEITWEVDDGYGGASRPQYAKIDDHEFQGLSLQEAKDLIDEAVRDEFESKISWHIKSRITDEELLKLCNAREGK